MSSPPAAAPAKAVPCAVLDCSFNAKPAATARSGAIATEAAARAVNPTKM
jgi:hypothetical protein